MSKIVLDEKEVNELMDTFDFNKSIYLKKLEEISISINKLDEIQKTQQDITNKFNFKDEQELTAAYGGYLAYLSKKIDELSKNSNLKRLEAIVSNSNNIVNFSLAKLAATITICVGAFYIITKLN